MTWLFKHILKIKNKTLMSILTVVNSVITLCLMGGFIALPFIKYGENARDFFFILWGVCFADFLAEMILISKRQITQNEKEARRYNKDKVVYWVSTIASVLTIAFALLLFLLKNNYELDIELYGIALAFLGMLILSALVTNLLAMYKDNYKQMARDGVLTFLSVFSAICIMSGFMALEKSPVAAKILIGAGTIFLFIVLVRRVFGAIVTITADKMNTAYSVIFLFIGIGILGGIILRYVIEDYKLQEIMTTIFAAIVGGVITLGGVAWTIQKSNHDRMEDDKKKAKPIFSFEMCVETLSSVAGKKICLTSENSEQYSCNVLALIENSDHSVFSIERVFHDGQWWEACGNKVVLPNAKVYLDINFNNNPEHIFMEIKDGMGTLYYYRIKVLVVPNKVDMSIPSFFHTVQDISEISFEEIEKRIKTVEN